MRTQTDYEVVNARGTLVFTAGDLALARRWVAEQADRLGELKIEIVYRTETRRAAPDSRVLPFAERLARRGMPR